MRLALEQAMLTADTADVPSVPSSSIADGEVVGVGCNAREADRDPTAHAEVLALRAAALASGSWRLPGCTLVVTLEPCTMCAGAPVLARVARIVFGAADPKAGAAGSLWDVVRDRRLNRRPGSGRRACCEQECGELLDAISSRTSSGSGRLSRGGVA